MESVELKMATLTSDSILAHQNSTDSHIRRTSPDAPAHRFRIYRRARRPIIKRAEHKCACLVSWCRCNNGDRQRRYPHAV